jgi:preprotein translocase subunit SecG
MLFTILVILFVIVCLLLCLLILIQSDKGGGISGAIGGGLGGASNLLGTQDTANILTRGTTIFATVFFLLCIAMSLVLSRQAVTVNKSLLQERAEKQQNFSPSSVLGGQGLPVQKESEAATGGEPSATAPGAAAEGTVLPVLPPAEKQEEKTE